MEFWIGFLFSTLVDAGRLDSEEFRQTEQAGKGGPFPRIDTLFQRIEVYIDALQASLSASVKNSSLNQTRQYVANACREAALQAQGSFTLTVPTGGGKTLSAMSFALRHALQHDLRRVIVVIPYTSTIELRRVSRRGNTSYMRTLRNELPVEELGNPALP
jgi:CRISPR-associated endonuclease/helicase Cas3